MKGNNDLAAVVFDWAGTTVDFGCRAPVEALRAAFRSYGVDPAEGDVRASMGLNKRDHISNLFESGWAPEGATVDGVYERFRQHLAEQIARFSEPIPGVSELARELRREGVRIGSSTGYSRPVLDTVLQVAAAAGFRVDASVSSSDVGAGRPAPFMIFRNAELLHIPDLDAIVKVGDTPADVAAGRAARVWTVGVVIGGNELAALDDPAGYEPDAAADRSLTVRQHALVARARRTLYAAGAHLVIDYISDLRWAMEVINERRARGEKP